jgi:hypothetical protein
VDKQNPLADVTDIVHRDSSETEPPYVNGVSPRKEEVSAEVPKFGVSGESHRASHFEIPTFEKDEA